MATVDTGGGVAGLVIKNDSLKCYCCGKMYPNKKSFHNTESTLYRGMGILPICKECVENLYSTYLSQCKSSKYAVRQVCRKLDILWDDSLFEKVAAKSVSGSIITQYIGRVNARKDAGLGYDGTLSTEGTLWSFEKQVIGDEIEEVDEEPVSPEVVTFWGTGYPPSMYRELETRKDYWMSKLSGEVDVGTEALVRQICALELDINRDRAAGQPVDKNINVLNNLLGSANLKPAQQKESVDSEFEKMPLGVGIQKWEYERPLPVTPEDQKDVHGIVKYITTWFLGHACKMVGLKNSYSKMYEDEMEELRIKRPEFADEDDDTLINGIFSSDKVGGDDG